MTSPEARIQVISGTEGLRFVQIEYRSEQWMPLHSHDGAATMVYCLAGSVEERWERATFVQTPSSLSLLPAGLPHANRFPRGSSIFQVVLETGWLDRDDRLAALVRQPQRERETRAAWIAARMHREFRNRDDFTPIALEGMLLEVLAEFARGAVGPPATGAGRWLPEAREYLHAHFKESVSSAEVAAVVGVHPSHLMRAFRQEYRCTIGDYVRRLRIEYACHLLSQPGWSLAEVAVEAGFADQSHFSHSFKRQTGMTPGAFAVSLRGRGSSGGPPDGS